MKKLLSLFFIVAISLNNLFAQEVNSEKFTSYGKVFGEVFGDFYYKAGSDTLLWGNAEFAKKEKDHSAFSFRRIYLGYEHHLSPVFSAKIMFESNDGQLFADGKKGGNIKYAYLQWNNIFPRANLIVGAMATPTWSLFTEKNWYYRSIEKTIMDFRKLGSSNDVGIALQGKFDEEGIFSYNLMIGNGRAQKPENNKYKKYYGSVNARLMDKKLLLELYADYEPAGNSKSKTTIKSFIGYQSDIVTIGFEPFSQIQANYKGGTDNIVVFGSTVFIRARVQKDKLNVFGRVDIYNPDTKDKDWGYKESFVVLGLDYTPMENVHIMPNLWINSYSEKELETQKRKSDFVPRITFHIKFK